MTPRSLHRRVPMSRLSIKNGWLALATGWIWSLKRGRCVQLLWSCAVVRRPKRSSSRFEAIWSLLDRAALWVSSIQTDVAANSSGLVDGTCAALMPTISRQIRSFTYLGRSGVDYLPTAMAAAVRAQPLRNLLAERLVSRRAYVRMGMQVLDSPLCRSRLQSRAATRFDARGGTDAS
jgi:hypothetical protein